VSSLESICEICGRTYSGPACIKCTQISFAINDFGSDTIGTPTGRQQGPKITAVAEPATSAPAASLKETTSGALYRLAKPACKIGRDKSNNLCLSYDSVADFHGLILFNADTYFLQDLSGQPGIFVNGEKISEPTELFDGDHIRIGDLRFYFVGER